MSINYDYKYAILEEDGWCREVRDTTDYVVKSNLIPISEYDEWYLEKYYNPMPVNPTSFDDFQGSWYLDENFTIPAIR